MNIQHPMTRNTPDRFRVIPIPHRPGRAIPQRNLAVTLFKYLDISLQILAICKGLTGRRFNDRSEGNDYRSYFSLL